VLYNENPPFDGRQPKMLREASFLEEEQFPLFYELIARCDDDELYDDNSNAFFWYLGKMHFFQELVFRRETFAERFVNSLESEEEGFSTLLEKSIATNNYSATSDLLESPYIDTEAKSALGTTAWWYAFENNDEYALSLLQGNNCAVPAGQRGSSYLTPAVLRGASCLRGIKLPCGFDETLKGVDIRYADLSQTSLTTDSLRFIRDLSNVRFPVNFISDRDFEEQHILTGADFNSGTDRLPASEEGTRHGRILRSAGKIIRYEKGQPPEGTEVSLLDLTDEAVSISSLRNARTFYGVVFPRFFDLNLFFEEVPIEECEFIYCDFSYTVGFPPYLYQRAKKAVGLRLPPDIDYNLLDVEDIDLSDTDFSLAYHLFGA
jgi:uncharacterized protein YjbI with pentapeptide repeats